MSHSWRYRPTKVHRLRWICRKCGSEIHGPGTPSKDMLLPAHPSLDIPAKSRFTCEELMVVETHAR